MAVLRAPTVALASLPSLLVLVFSTSQAQAYGRLLSGKASPPPPSVHGIQPVLFVLRADAPIGCPQDGSPGLADAGRASDPPPSGTDGGAGDPSDAGPDAAACVPRRGPLVTVIIQPRFEGGASGSDFVLLWATPSAPVVTTAPADLFARLEDFTAPLEVPVYTDVEDSSLGYKCDQWGSSDGCGYQSQPIHEPTPPPPELPPGSAVDAGLPDAPVPLGSYEVAVLAADTPAILAWLDEHAYQHDAADDQAIAAYATQGWTIVAARLRAEAPVATIEPLSFTFEGDAPVLPVALSRVPGGGLEPIEAYIAASGRYQFPDATVHYAEWFIWTPETTFLTSMTLLANLGNGPEFDPRGFHVVGDPVEQEQTEVETIRRVPSSECPEGHGGDWGPHFGCGCRLSPRDRHLPGTLVLGLAALVAGVLLRRRRR